MTNRRRRQAAGLPRGFGPSASGWLPRNDDRFEAAVAVDDEIDWIPHVVGAPPHPDDCLKVSSWLLRKDFGTARQDDHREQHDVKSSHRQVLMLMVAVGDGWRESSRAS